MTLTLQNSFATQYKPSSEEETEAREKIVRILQAEPDGDFFQLVKNARQAGVRDDVFDYVFGQLKREGFVALTDDFKLEVAR